MSRVIVRPINVLGGVPNPTTFSDDFNRASLGANWLLGQQNPNMVGSYNPANAIGLAANTLFMQNNTGAGQALMTRVQPIAHPVGTFMNREQFAEITVTAGAAALVACGPGVALIANHPQPDAQGYYLGIGVSVCDLRRATAPATVLTAAFTAAANGDKFRITVAFGVGSNTIRTFKNDVLVNTTVDNVTPSPGGLPGMFGGACVAGTVINFDNFRCGLGSGS